MSITAKVVRIVPSVSLVVCQGDELTLNTLQEFIDQAKAIGVATTTPLKTTISSAYRGDQRDGSPGGFSIQAADE